MTTIVEGATEKFNVGWVERLDLKTVPTANLILALVSDDIADHLLAESYRAQGGSTEQILGQLATEEHFAGRRALRARTRDEINLRIPSR